MALRIALPKRIQELHPRTAKALQNGFWSLVIKGTSILISLMSVPITFDYLSKTTYGVWLTISSLTTLMALLDVGVGNGLRNRFAEAISVQDHTLAQSYLSTAYVLFGGVQLVLSLLFIVLNQFLPWPQLLNTTMNSDELRLVVSITFLSISIRLTLDLLFSTLHALQNSAKIGFIQLIINALVVAGIYGLSVYSPGNLINLAIVTGIVPIGVMVISSIILFRTSLKEYKPNFNVVDRQYTNNLLSIGVKFFVIQIAVIIIFYTDNLIITQLFGPAEVAPYSVAYRYFNLAITIFTLVIAPFWSAYTEAHVKQDYTWMIAIYRRLQQFWLVMVVVVIGMILLANWFYYVWLNNRVEVPILLSLFMGISVIITCWNNIAVSVINGVGKIRLQLYVAVASAIMNIPLAVLFGKFFQLGSAGVILATCVCLLLSSVLGAMQAGRILKQTATGIWNQ